LSENITVRSIIGRFLEHSRIYYFENACQPQVFVTSADWLPRNFFRRIELAFPIEDGVLRERIINEILALNLADNTRARELQPDGTYRRIKPARGAKSRNCQVEFIELAKGNHENHRRQSGRKSYPRVRLAPS